VGIVGIQDIAVKLALKGFPVSVGLAALPAYQGIAV
jgi:hypothetical protein